jgi:hypothetical protein
MRKKQMKSPWLIPILQKPPADFSTENNKTESKADQGTERERKKNHQQILHIQRDPGF